MPTRLSVSIISAFVALNLAAPLEAQRPGAGATVDSAMAQLAWLVGEWEGEGTSMMQGGSNTATVRERVEARLNGRAFVIEGIGREPAADGKGRVVHHAFGLLTYDPERKQYAFMALNDGGVVNAESSLVNGVFTWGFSVPGGRIRFHIRQVNGEWHETGEFSADGSTWRQMLDMRLRRVSTAR